MAVQRLASDCVAESTVSVVALPDDSIKGRIIGREGRNIRALEQAPELILLLMILPERLCYQVSIQSAEKLLAKHWNN